MPMFEYRCTSCGHRFEALVFGSRKPVCPKCKSEELEKELSRFGTGGSGRGWSGGSSAPSCSTGGG